MRPSASLATITVVEAGDLYGLPLERFVPERTALAKALRQEGKREEATEVAKLPKPSRAAWAVNQLVRTQGRTISSLFEAGDALQQAQSDVIAGRGDARKLRDAADTERAAVKRLTDAARGLLSADGHALTAATLDRVSETFHAAALDEDARQQVEQGCLERELRHVGLGGPGGLTMTPAPPSKAPPKSSADQAQRRTRESTRGTRDEAERKAEEAARHRAEQLKAARREEAEARQAADRAAKQLHAAEQRRDRAAEALSAAEEALAEAQTEADRAKRAHEQAREGLDRLQQS